jgi:REP element-mobilizing transposase RayT
MELIGNMLENFNITLHAYCLMTNHYHLLLETKEENISEAKVGVKAKTGIKLNKT